MPRYCLVYGCKSRGERDPVCFYRIPGYKNTNGKTQPLRLKRRQKWIQALQRNDLTETKINNGRICSKHFINGHPASLYETDDPDWVPTVLMGYNVIYKSLTNTNQAFQVECTEKYNEKVVEQNVLQDLNKENDHLVTSIIELEINNLETIRILIQNDQSA